MGKLSNLLEFFCVAIKKTPVIQLQKTKTSDFYHQVVLLESNNRRN